MGFSFRVYICLGHFFPLSREKYTVCICLEPIASGEAGRLREKIEIERRWLQLYVDFCGICTL